MRACVECPETWAGDLLCPSCGSPGEPLSEPRDILGELVGEWREWSERHNDLRGDIDRAHAALIFAVQAWNEISEETAERAQGVHDAQDEAWQSSPEGEAVQAWIDRIERGVLKAPPLPGALWM